ncbi:hypothetical protein BHF71_11005 [Vulcanibacillus modesticaldus]|uniref:Gluconeogenesis factor n=1 Tax=Vulcanibacillus modesticaldus TaxID=337097 RepID=A0A1D2YSM8_9BACI|nr:YvcK family protein [Vulcanibacillus modesticaldus]OEF97792.1 hypothetical protein BHF71_11005 [Vulcanibacillus modesticaldus]
MEDTNKKKIVVIGGGTGLSVILRGLKKKDIEISAIVTVADDGGSSGRLRDELDMLPPGDIRNVIIALANTEPLLEKLLQYRFQKGDGLAGHTLGNLFIAAMQEITGDFVLAIKEISRVLAVKGQVLPATLQKIVLYAELEDGSIVKGESNIPNTGKAIKRVFIKPDNVKPLIEALRVIEEADAIIIGPGSLYTSIIPNLLVPKLKETILLAKGKKIFISNVMTQPGETDGYTALDHVEAIERHVGQRFIEYVIVNDENIPEEIIEQYRLKGAEPVIADQNLFSKGYQVITDKFLKYNAFLRHDADKLAECVLNILD